MLLLKPKLQAVSKARVANSNAVARETFFQKSPYSVIPANDNFKRLGMAKAHQQVVRGLAVAKIVSEAIQNDLRAYVPKTEPVKNIVRQIDFQPAQMVMDEPQGWSEPEPEQSFENFSDTEQDPGEFFRQWQQERAFKYGFTEVMRVVDTNRVAICIKRRARRKALGKIGYFWSKANRRKNKPNNRTWRSRIYC